MHEEYMQIKEELAQTEEIIKRFWAFFLNIYYIKK